MGNGDVDALVVEARTLAAHLLRDLPQRLAHSRSAAHQAGHALASTLDDVDSATVVAAAWLHDVGYSTDVVRSGFHPLDGALFLSAAGWPDDVVRLVAHHSHASVLAPFYGVAAQLRRIVPASIAVSDLMTYADLTAGVSGRACTPRQRVAEMRLRHANDAHVPHHARERRYAMLLDSAGRVQSRLLPHGWPRVG